MTLKEGMTLKEAMTDLSIQREAKKRLGEEFQEDALTLGIEALKVFAQLPPMFRVTPFGLLPGETKE